MIKRSGRIAAASFHIALEKSRALLIISSTLPMAFGPGPGGKQWTGPQPLVNFGSQRFQVTVGVSVCCSSQQRSEHQITGNTVLFGNAAFAIVSP